MKQKSKPFRVLSLDGGGMRGTYTTTYLDRVASAFATRRGVNALDIGAAFDLIVGTSTGGIVACALAKGIPLSEITGLYVKHGPMTFARPLPGGVFGAVGDIRNRPQALAKGRAVPRRALDSRFGKTTLGEIYTARGISLAIPATEIGQHRAWVFKTPHLKDTTNHRDDHYTLVDVCLATTAAPIYRSMAAVDQPDNDTGGYNVFVDGGLWANNPVPCRAHRRPRHDRAGSGNSSLQPRHVSHADRRARRQDRRPIAGYWNGNSAAVPASLAIDAQQFAFDHMAKKLARHVERRCTVVRFPSEKVPAALSPYLGLDDTRDEAIRAVIDQAQTDANMANSKCAYSDTDPEAALIRALFEAMPEATYSSECGNSTARVRHANA